MFGGEINKTQKKVRTVLAGTMDGTSNGCHPNDNRLDIHNLVVFLFECGQMLYEKSVLD